MSYNTAETFQFSAIYTGTSNKYEWCQKLIYGVTIQLKMFNSKPLHVACITQTLLIYRHYEPAKTSEYGVCVCVCELHSTAFHNSIMLYRMFSYQQPSHNYSSI